MADYSKLDHWSIKAQKEGYPARSVYKLKEMDEKFGLVKTGRSSFKVLDLGAAPGSWSLYVMRKLFAGKDGRTGGGAAIREIPPQPQLNTCIDVTLNAESNFVSIDLAPLSRQYDKGLFDRPDFFFLQRDFTRSDVREEILARGPYNLIMSDAAPATTGNRSVDTLRSLDLAETALGYAETALVKGGNLVIKVFQGGDTGALLKTLRGLFESGKSFKPQASRAESFETYYLGLGKSSSFTLEKG